MNDSYTDSELKALAKAGLGRTSEWSKQELERRQKSRHEEERLIEYLHNRV